MDELDYWTRPDRTPKPVIDVHGARCRRCPHPLPSIPVDKIRLGRRGADAFRAFLVCPHCRATVTAEVGLETALAAYAAGAQVQRAPVPDAPLALDDVLDFALAASRTDELARLALRDALA